MLPLPQGAAPFSEESAKQLVTKVLTGTAVTLPLLVSPSEGGRCCSGLVLVPGSRPHTLRWLLPHNLTGAAAAG